MHRDGHNSSNVFINAFIQKNKFSLKSLFFITFIISIIITIYVLFLGVILLAAI